MSEGTLADGALPDAPAPESAGALLRRALASSWLVLGGFGGAQLIRLAGNLILTRLLVAEDFGLMALVAAVLSGLGMFSDWGISQAIVQNEHGEEPRFLATAYTLSVVRGALIWLIAALIAGWVARFYGHPDLAWVLPISGVVYFLDGIASMRVHTNNRRIRIGRVVSLDLISQATGLATMVGWALLDPSILALVAGGIAASFVKMVVSHLWLPGRPDRFGWDAQSARRLVVFARWILVSTIITFFAVQIDRLTLGKLVSLDQLGIYNIGSVLSLMPAIAIGGLGQVLAFPLYSRAFARGANGDRVFRSVRAPITALSGWATSFLIAGAPTVVTILYDSRYWSAGWIVQVLLCGSWFLVLDGTIASALLATGRVKWIASSNAGKLAGFLLLAPFCYAHFGFAGVVAAVSLSEIARYGVAVVGARRAGIFAVATDLRFTLLTASATAALYLLQRELVSLSIQPVVICLTLLGVSTLLWAPVLAFCVRRMLHAGE